MQKTKTQKIISTALTRCVFPGLAARLLSSGDFFADGITDYVDAKEREPRCAWFYECDAASDSVKRAFDEFLVDNHSNLWDIEAAAFKIYLEEEIRKDLKNLFLVLIFSLAAETHTELSPAQIEALTCIKAIQPDTLEAFSAFNFGFDDIDDLRAAVNSALKEA